MSEEVHVGVQDTIALQQAAERLRQERETFDQKKQQDRRWFSLRLAMGWTSVVLLPTIMTVSSWIIFHRETFSEATVTLAASALLVDTLGLVLSIWRIVVTAGGPEKLAPVTRVAAEVAES